MAENAALSFGDDLPGGEISELDREFAIRDWMGVSLDAAVACTAANLGADFTAELRAITAPAQRRPAGLCSRYWSRYVTLRDTVHPDQNGQTASHDRGSQR